MPTKIFPEDLPDAFVPYPESSPYNPLSEFGDKAAFRYRGLVYDMYDILQLSTLTIQQLMELSTEEMSKEILRIKRYRPISTLECLPIPENGIDNLEES